MLQNSLSWHNSVKQKEHIIHKQQHKYQQQIHQFVKLKVQQTNFISDNLQQLDYRNSNQQKIVQQSQTRFKRLKIVKYINNKDLTYDLQNDNIEDTLNKYIHKSQIFNKHKYYKQKQRHQAYYDLEHSSNINSLNKIRTSQSAQKVYNKSKELFKRVSIGLLLGAFGYSIVSIGGLLYSLWVALAVLITSTEYNYMVEQYSAVQQSEAPSTFLKRSLTFLNVSLIVVTFVSFKLSKVIFGICGILVLTLEFTGKRKPRFQQLALSVFSLFYCGFLPSYWVSIRMLQNTPGYLLRTLPIDLNGTVFIIPVSVGFVATVCTILCIVASDVGAYFIGKNFGRTKLTDISPKKTLEGAFGGLGCSLLTAIVFKKLYSWPQNFPLAIIFGVMVFFSSLYGDLIESIMKRDAGLKDSGNIFPGHGGFLDRFDSYILTGALSYFFTKHLSKLLV